MYRSAPFLATALKGFQPDLACEAPGLARAGLPVQRFHHRPQREVYCLLLAKGTQPGRCTFPAGWIYIAFVLYVNLTFWLPLLHLFFAGDLLEKE